MSVSIEREEIYKKLTPSLHVAGSYWPASKTTIYKTDCILSPIEITERVGREVGSMILTKEMIVAIRKVTNDKGEVI